MDIFLLNRLAVLPWVVPSRVINRITPRIIKRLLLKLCKQINFITISELIDDLSFIHQKTLI